MQIIVYRKVFCVMKKICLIILSLILCACHTTPQLEGEWKCEKSPLENKDIYTAYLTLEIDKDLSFNMYDAEAGNPVIRGKMIKKDHTLTLQCNHLDDFDPPDSWESMKTTETIQYYFKNNKLYLKFNNSTLVFYKKQKITSSVFLCF